MKTSDWFALLIAATWGFLVGLWLLNLRRREKAFKEFMDKQVEFNRAQNDLNAKQSKWNQETHDHVQMLMEALLNGVAMAIQHQFKQTGSVEGDGFIEIKLQRVPGPISPEFEEISAQVVAEQVGEEAGQTTETTLSQNKEEEQKKGLKKPWVQ